jgi:hypothetical protein
MKTAKEEMLAAKQENDRKHGENRMGKSKLSSGILTGAKSKILTDGPAQIHNNNNKKTQRANEGHKQHIQICFLLRINKSTIDLRKSPLSLPHF